MIFQIKRGFDLIPHIKIDMDISLGFVEAH